jgi:hypothetical protein
MLFAIVLFIAFEAISKKAFEIRMNRMRESYEQDLNRRFKVLVGRDASKSSGLKILVAVNGITSPLLCDVKRLIGTLCE